MCANNIAKLGTRKLDYFLKYLNGQMKIIISFVLLNRFFFTKDGVFGYVTPNSYAMSGSRAMFEHAHVKRTLIAYYVIVFFEQTWIAIYSKSKI